MNKVRQLAHPGPGRMDDTVQINMQISVEHSGKLDFIKHELRVTQKKLLVTLVQAAIDDLYEEITKNRA